MSTLQHGTPVESWTIHTHEVRLICPKCREMLSRPHMYHYRDDYGTHTIACTCGQFFGIKWQDETQDAQVTIHTWADIDIPTQEAQ